MREYQCVACKEVFHYTDEVVFDGDELKTVDERNPDWHSCMCRECHEAAVENEAIAAAHRKAEGI